MTITTRVTPPTIFNSRLRDDSAANIVDIVFFVFFPSPSSFILLLLSFFKKILFSPFLSLRRELRMSGSRNRYSEHISTGYHLDVGGTPDGGYIDDAVGQTDRVRAVTARLWIDDVIAYSRSLSNLAM